MEQAQPETSLGSKRKRVDDGTPPRSPNIIAGSAKPEWDKTTFRVSRIPERPELEDLSQVLVQIFGVTVANFKIHSLALDNSDEADPPSKTATVSFRAIPALLRGSKDLAGYWDFGIPDTEAAKCGHCQIIFDTHFNGFTPLSPADHTSRPIDCIVIPGWGGYALGSFRSHTSPYVWLRDSLPRHCPKLRVWTYGYLSYFSDANSSADVYEFAERFRRRLRILRQQTKSVGETKPLIFIVHSLGGWIFKDAMIQMRYSTNEIDQDNLRSTYGALLFGVPTQGMNVNAIASMVRDLPARYISALIDSQDGFRLRHRQHEAFCKAFDYKDSKIVNFFELKKSPTVIQDPDTRKWSRAGPPALLVTPASVMYGRAWETSDRHIISLDGNHSDMVTFSENGLDDYTVVLDVVQKLTEQAASAVGARRKTSPDVPESIKPDRLTLEEQERLQSLHFFEMTCRRNEIVDPANGTSEWLSKNPTYLGWFGQQHGMLWVKGKPGAGKSTLMKRTIWDAEQVRGENAVLASFFFHGRGALLQKNITGLFRSLLHQVLQQLPELLKEFSRCHQERTETEGKCGETWEWHEKELQHFFKTHIVKAARTRTIRLYIDALDEAGEDSAIELVDFFQQTSSSLAICFSCRHYPLIALENGLEVCVEDVNGPDINSYIKTSIDARISRADVACQICNEIAAKALGNFQWGVLVVRLILEQYRNGSSLAVLKMKISQLPSELVGLYRELLGSIHEEDLPQSLLLFQWILFSLKPLTSSELRFALLMDQETSYISFSEYQSSGLFSSTEGELKRKIIALSKGLINVSELRVVDAYNGAISRYVQFIHQSVKDFLLEGGLQMLDKGHLKDAIARGHFCLSRSCIRYSTMEDVRHWVRHRGRENFLYQDPDIVLPLLEYAARFWHLHSEEVEKRDPVLANLLSMVWRSSDTMIQTWIDTSEMLGLNDGPRFPKHHWNLLHVASMLNLPSVVSAMLDQGLAANKRVRGGKTPLSIAMRAGSDEVVKILLDRRNVKRNSLDDNGRTPLLHAVRSRHKATLKLLVNREDIDFNLRDSTGSSPLSHAIGFCYDDIVAVLLQHSNIDADYRDFSERTPLYTATSLGYEAIVKLLLDRKDIDPNAKDHSGRSPLLWAIENNCEGVVKLLLDRKDIDTGIKDCSGRTLLSYAAEKGNEVIVKWLLDRNDVNPNVQDFDGRIPFFYASRSGHPEIATMILDGMMGARRS